jgi:hypothetical protein
MIPAGFEAHLKNVHASLGQIEGWLSDREVDFLALLAACPTAHGEIVELGTYHGKSTIALASSVALSDQATVVTVDCQPGLPTIENLKRAGVAERVKVHCCYSTEFTASWDGPIRLLWHDGANSRDVVHDDLEKLLPFLSDCGMVAFHDVLNPSGERIAVFVDHILASKHFGFSGVCGSIGWAQYHKEPRGASPHRVRNEQLRRRLKPLIAYQVADQPPPRGFAKVRYKLLRARVPHGRVHPEDWVREAA